MNLWIKTSISLSRHPKTRHAAELLGVDVPTLIGHLIMLWCYVLEFYPDGCLPSKSELCRGAGWPVDDAERFVLALLRAGEPTRAGFIEIEIMLSERCDEEAPIYLHDWIDYSGTFDAKKRGASQREEKKREYIKKKEEMPVQNQKPPTKEESAAAVRAAFRSILSNIAKKP